MNIDYTKIAECKMQEMCGGDASKWASAFCQVAKSKGLEIDEGWMIGWFSNAMEASWDKRIKIYEIEAYYSRKFNDVES